MLDSTMTKEIEYGYYSWEFLNKIQTLRKESNLELTADIEIFYEAHSDELKEAIELNLGGMWDKLKKRFIDAKNKPVAYPVIASSSFKVQSHTAKIYICNVGISFDREWVLAKLGDQ